MKKIDNKTTTIILLVVIKLILVVGASVFSPRDWMLTRCRKSGARASTCTDAKTGTNANDRAVLTPSVKSINRHIETRPWAGGP